MAGKLQLYLLDENAAQRNFNIGIAKTSKNANCDLFGSGLLLLNSDFFY